MLPGVHGRAWGHAHDLLPRGREARVGLPPQKERDKEGVPARVVPHCASPGTTETIMFSLDSRLFTQAALDPSPPLAFLRHTPTGRLRLEGTLLPLPCCERRRKPASKSQPSGKWQSSSGGQWAWPSWGLEEAGSRWECVVRIDEWGS